MVVTIHQPEHLPWLGFFDKIRQVDVFVILDHVQYRRRYYQNRNRIPTAQGVIWLTVPVQVKGKYDQAINQVQIDNHSHLRWRQKCWATMEHNYRKAPYFSDYAEFFEHLYRKEWNSLVDLNESIIRYLVGALGINVAIHKSSSLDATADKGDLMLEICRQLGATTYLSGISGKDYLDQGKFSKNNIQLKFQEFHHPIYKQFYKPFRPCMSVIDLLFNYGPTSLDVITGVGVETMDQVFT